MKKLYSWMIAAILTISGTTVPTSCSSSDDNPSDAEKEVKASDTSTVTARAGRR